MMSRKQIIGIVLWLLFLPFVSAQNIVGYEYWLDDDYSNKVFTGVTPTPTLQLNNSIDFSAEQSGLHIFNIRFLEENDKWSNPISYFFYKPTTLELGVDKVSMYQYWMDDDFASAVNTDVTQAQQVDVSSSINMSSLNNGLHIFNIRYKNAASVWSSVLSQFVYKLPASVTNNTVVEVQYWIDDNMASAQNISVSAAQSIVLNEDLDMSAQQTGLHLFNIRMKDANGLWSSVKSQFFYKKQPDVSKNIVRYQYWVNDDFDNATTVDVTPDVDFQLLEDVDFSELMPGVYNLQVRFQDSEGEWSSPLGQDFLKTALSLDDNLWAYYKFNGDANDYSGNNHHGTTFGGVTSTADNFGNNNGAYAFDGVDGYIDLGTWTNGGAMSISFWAKWDAFNNYSRIVDLGNGSSSNNIIVSNYQTSGRFFFQIYSTSTVGNPTSTAVISQSVWNYYTVTVDESGYMKAYQNGAVVVEGSGLMPQTVERAKQYVGKSNFTQDGYFNGAIDELRIYNKALSEEEIAGLYSFNPTGLSNEIIWLSNTEVYPNPVADDLNIDINLDGEYLVSVYSTSGKLVYQQKYFDSKATVSMSEFEAGMYIVQIQHPKGSKVVKVMKK